MSTDAEKVRAAADYIDRVGLHKGSLNAGGLPTAGAVAKGVQCCALGALFGHGVEARLLDDLGTYLAESHPRLLREDILPDGRAWASVSDWNDRPSRRKKDVVTLLRGFADELEEKS